MVPAVRHHNVIVLLRDNDISFAIQFQLRGFVFFMARIAIQTRCITSGLYQVRRREPRRRRADEIAIYERKGSRVDGLPARIQQEDDG